MSCNAKKDPNGTWRIQYRWTDWTGTKKKSQKRGFKTKKEAEEWRNVTIAFRMSPEENEELDLRVKLCGYQTRQEYIIESVLHQKVTAVGNPLMLVQFRKQLRGIEEELKRLTILEDADEELFTPIRTMLEILNAFAEERNYEKRKSPEII